MSDHTESLDRDPQAGARPDAANTGADKPAAAPLKNPWVRLGLLVALVVIVAGVGLWFVYEKTRGQYLQTTNDAQLRTDYVTIAPRTTGYVAEVLVSDNQDVAAGQPLVRVDSRDYRAQAEQAKADIAVAEASTRNAEAQVHEQEATIAQTRAQLDGTKAKAAYDAGEVARYTPLAATDAEPRAKLAQLRAAATQSASEAKAQAASLEMQQRRVAGLKAQVDQAQAQAQSARAKLDAVDVDLDATLLRAPVAGRVGDKTVTVGQYAPAGTRLMSLAPADKLYLVANFKETQLGLMRPGQPATIKVDALPGIALKGHVSSVAPGTGAEFSLLPPDNATGNFTKIVQRVPVRIELEAGPTARRLLVPGLSVTATVDTLSAKDTRMVLKQEQKRIDGQGR